LAEIVDEKAFEVAFEVQCRVKGVLDNGVRRGHIFVDFGNGEPSSRK
jgi:hypothetical protein